MKGEPLRILVTNDDGIDAPGLWHLAEAMADVGRVLVVAPAEDQSGAGTAVTYRRDIGIRSVESTVPESKAYAVDGTPADCIIVGLRHVKEGRIGLIAAGINLGPNLGSEVLLSGTVGAALQGGFRRLPSLAISLHGRPDGALEWPTAQAVARLMARSLADGSLEDGLFLNVNVPSLPVAALKGLALTRVAPGGYLRLVEKGGGPEAERLSRRIEPDLRYAEEGTDIWAVSQGLVSVSPLRATLTDLPLLERLQPLASDLFSRLRSAP